MAAWQGRRQTNGNVYIGGGVTREHDGNGKPTTPRGNQEEHEDSNGTRNMLSALERLEEDGSGGATIACGGEEQRRAQGPQ
uniref:Uncharacterized protein n=1 Tax=Phyllostachys edulis TaxID=38705 RepID=D3IVK7_PHYED|nr:hypothetical protein [Phyllostachys edulis]